MSISNKEIVGIWLAAVFGVCWLSRAVGRVFQKVHVQPTTLRLIAYFHLSNGENLHNPSVGDSQTASAVLRRRFGRGFGGFRAFVIGRAFTDFINRFCGLFCVLVEI